MLLVTLANLDALLLSRALLELVFRNAFGLDRPGIGFGGDGGLCGPCPNADLSTATQQPGTAQVD